MGYKILLQPSAIKDLDKLPYKDAEKISYRILQLKENPRPVGVQKQIMKKVIEFVQGTIEFFMKLMID